MSYTINDALKETTEAARAALATDLPQARKVIKSFLRSRKERAEDIVKKLESGKINAATLGIVLSNEEKILKSELRATRILTKSAAQHAANAAIKTLEKALLRVAGM